MTSDLASESVSELVEELKRCHTIVSEELEQLLKRWGMLRDVYKGEGAQNMEHEIELIRAKYEHYLEQLIGLRRISEQRIQDLALKKMEQ
ncbi:hypothetical protein FGD67_20110 [Colwellia sp. M166]|uniref:hypothetical protein n=1 Tax=Colwellia sp. M166 TaxID=2583805 RepID=UPI00211EAF45|nr:hypothetical protein [Colwellia sp. M166]UUO25252.1 hypothetical protein FGD67_20110 [Colwellia sp. M166]|tara:strand:- start:309 stop:578 length:270 start_codon:yes stop_codon:yes gene_type:complete